MNKPSKKLQALWARKLKASGFKDIEEPDSSRELLKRWEASYFKDQYTPEQFQAKQRYYELAVLFLERYAFENAKERKLWELHANGATVAKIAKAIRWTDIGKTHGTIKRLATIMLKTSAWSDELSASEKARDVELAFAKRKA